MITSTQLFNNTIPQLIDALDNFVTNERSIHKNFMPFDNLISDFKEKVIEEFLEDFITKKGYRWSQDNFKTKFWAIEYIANKENIFNKLVNIIQELSS